MMIEEYKEAEHCRVAVCNIIGAKNEDRWSYKMSHGDHYPKCQNLSSFSIFDGHASKVVSEYLSKKLESNIAHALSSRLIAAENFSPLLAEELATTPRINSTGPSLARTSSNASGTSTGPDSNSDANQDEDSSDVGMDLDLDSGRASRSSLSVSTMMGGGENGNRNNRSASIRSTTEPSLSRMTETNKFDAILCDAINTEVQRIDKNVRGKTAAGSTYCGLFLKKESDGSIKAFCANVGDSRCLMVTVESEFIPSPHSREESEDIEDSTHATSSVWDSEHMNERTKEFQLLTRNNSKIGLSSIEEIASIGKQTSSMKNEKVVKVPSSAKLSERAGGLKRNDSIVQFRSPVSDLDLGGNADALGASNHSEMSATSGSEGGISSDGEATHLANMPPGAVGWKDRLSNTGVNRLTTIVYMMSEDHSLVNARERRRIGTHKGNFRYDIPSEACIISPSWMIPSHLLDFDSDTVPRRSSPGRSMKSSRSDNGNDKEKEKGSTDDKNEEGNASVSQIQMKLSSGGPDNNDKGGEAPDASSYRKTAFDHYLFEALRSGSPTRKLIKTSVAYMEKLKMFMDTEGKTPSPLLDASMRLTTPTPPLTDSPLATRRSMTLPSNTRIDEDIHAPRNFQALGGKAGGSVAGSSPDSNSPRTEDSTSSDLPIDPDLICPQQMYKHSFISRRVSADGQTVGPEAIFGRFNVSIMMTRSIGDKFGPRSCIAVPEIAAKVIPRRRFARFILASDGFWDVASFEIVRMTAMKSKYRDPRVLAKHLADKGKRYRNKKFMRADDITVMVVDVNAEDIVSVDGPDGEQNVKVEKGPDGSLREVSGSACVPGGCAVS